MNTTLLKFGRALLFALLSASAGSALATPNFGTRLDNWCALQPIQSSPPQQSRPYRAANFSCSTCHNTNNPSTSDLNARGNASASCTGTTCGTAVNNFCIATPSTASTIAIASPPAGAVVAQGQPVTFTAGGTSTSPDGFLLSYTWLFSNGLPSASGFSVTVPMTAAGAVTATLQVRNQVGMLATGTPPTRTITVTPAANMAPTATISAPAGNVTVAQGGTVTFTGSGSDPDNNLPLTYSWNFGGGAANSTAQNPGAVTFNTAGTFTVNFTVTDSLGLASTPVTRVITVTPVANMAPTATISAPAGNVTVAQGGTVTFTGSGSDPDNNLPLTYSWNFGGGAANSTAQNPGAVTFNTAGTFTVSFTVTDSLGLASTPVTRVITVTPVANMAPTATISAPSGNVTVAQGGTVTFMGSGTDPDNNLPLTYSWNFGGGAANSTAQNPGSVTFNTAGTFTVNFTVTDSLGLASTPVTRVITVTPVANMAPTATISAPSGNVTVAQGGTVTFMGAGTDPDNNLPLTYSWNFGGGAANSNAQNPGAVTFNTAGTFTVSFTVTDSLGLASTPVTRIVTVMGVGQQPVAIIEEPKQDRTIARGRSIEFHATADNTSEDDDDLIFNWSFPGGTPVSSFRKEVNVFFHTAGIFTVTLTATDSQGRVSAPVSRVVTVTGPANMAPTATISAPAGDVTVAQGGTVNFQGSGADPDNNTPLTYMWNFGGGAANSTAQNPGAVMFDTAGTFTVTFTVTDSLGLASTPVTRVITVTPPANMAPTATISAPAGDVTVAQGGTVNFQGSGADPDNNLPLTYNWNFGGGAANSTAQNPGAVTFDTAGTFTVTFTITDSLGLSSTPVTRTVTVTPAGMPVAEIVAPAMNVSVLPRGRVTFRGAASGVDNPRFRWTFEGGNPNRSTRQNPGEVRFDRVGAHTVTLTVTDSDGEVSAPVTRVITVARPNATPRVDDCRDDRRRD